MAETGTECFNFDLLAHDPMLSWKGCQEEQGRSPNLAIDQNHWILIRSGYRLESLEMLGKLQSSVSPLEILFDDGVQRSLFLTGTPGDFDVVISLARCSKEGAKAHRMGD